MALIFFKLVAAFLVFLLVVFLLVFYIFSWSSQIVGLIIGRYKFDKRNRVVVPKPANLPGVSIIKPLKGVDDNLYENLSSFFHIDYPLYEIVFCIQEATDPAVDVVKRLIAEYPGVDARLFYGEKMACPHPKTSTLLVGYRHLKYNLMLMSDSGIKTTRDAVYDMVTIMESDARIGIVHQMPYVCERPEKEVTIYERLYNGTWQARFILFINWLGMNCVCGMSFMMRKNVIDELGGLIYFGNFTAEDYFITHEFLKKKYKVVVANELAWQNCADYSISILNERIVRWTTMRVRYSVGSWFQPLGECFGHALSGALIYYYYTHNHHHSILFFFVNVVVWYFLDYALLQTIENGKFKYGRFEILPHWLYRETICYWLYLRGVCTNRILWRGVVYKVTWGGGCVKVEDDPRSKSISVKPVEKKQVSTRVDNMHVEHEMNTKWR